MGIHLSQARSKRLPTMAHIWSSHGGAPLDLAWLWLPGGTSQGHLLHHPFLDVPHKLRGGGLGYT